MGDGGRSVPRKPGETWGIFRNYRSWQAPHALHRTAKPSTKAHEPYHYVGSERTGREETDDGQLIARVNVRKDQSLFGRVDNRTHLLIAAIPLALRDIETEKSGDIQRRARTQLGSNTPSSCLRKSRFSRRTRRVGRLIPPLSCEMKAMLVMEPRKPPAIFCRI